MSSPLNIAGKGTWRSDRYHFSAQLLELAQPRLRLSDAEWLQAMQFGVQEVCRIFRVPPILVQELTHATYTNVIELGQQFVRFSLQRWLTVWEEAISRSLLGPIARQRFYAEHSLEGLLRAQSKDRAEFYASGISAGWLDVEEVRRLENLPQRKSLAAD